MKQHPAWLAELHRQWYAARGKKLDVKSRPFSRGWIDLLDAAGVISAEDTDTAERELVKFADAGYIVLTRHRYRPRLIERIALPLESEAWLRGLFESPAPVELRRQSLEHIEAALRQKHPLYPALWLDWLEQVRLEFEAGRHLRPLFWSRPALVRQMLELSFGITAESRPSDTFIREASAKLGLGSKGLERSRRVLESCLGSLFGRAMTLEMLGITGSQPRVEIAGEISLQLPDGSIRRIDQLDGVYHLTSDLLESVKATTPAKRILTIENTKTTLRRIATLNADKETLIVACAYPSRGLLHLLSILPGDLPIHHFGDTDPAGFLILSKLRQAADRPVVPFLMQRRESDAPSPLTSYDRAILPALLADPLLEDVRPYIEAISSSDNKGDFEQETLGRPDLSRWPFYRSHPEAG